MNILKPLLIFLLLIASALDIYSSPQSADILIYNGDTLKTFIHLPDDFYDNDKKTININLFGKEEYAGFVSDCARGYLTEWAVTDKQLYLTGIYSCDYTHTIKADLQSLFKDKCVGGRVKADWITKTILCGYGNLITYAGDFLPIYDKELKLEFVNGELRSEQFVDNSKSKKSVYSQDSAKLMEFIYSNINWDSLPDLEKETRVIISFSANEEGKIDKPEVVKGDDDELFNQEAIRVVKAIPEWDVFFSGGKHIKVPWSIAVKFSEENKAKYAHGKDLYNR